MSDTTSNENESHAGHGTAKPSWLMIGIVGALVVVLSFFASFWGASIASAPSEPDSAIAEESAEPSTDPSTEPTTEAPEAELPPVLPAGADVRVGAGLPDAGHGSDGDVFIDIDTADTFVRTDGEWLRVGNIRTSALENLAGEQGDKGKTGEQGNSGEAGEAGEAGAPGSDGVAGADGTQVVLGGGSPDSAKSCGSAGDVFIDTVAMAFYKCTGENWAPFTP